MDEEKLEQKGGLAAILNLPENLPQPEQEDKLVEQDRYTLEMVKMKKALGQANYEKAAAQADAINMYYDNIVLQLSIKYSLTKEDTIAEDGTIQRGGATK